MSHSRWRTDHHKAVIPSLSQRINRFDGRGTAECQTQLDAFHPDLFFMVAHPEGIEMEGWNGTSGNDLSNQERNEQDLYDTFLQGSRFWIQRVLLPLVVVIGVVGNGITIIVLTRPKMRSSTNTYLTALAISDLMYLVFVLTISLGHYPGIHNPNFYYYWQYHRFGLWLTDATASTSVLLTVTFTIERYIAVCHPMRGKLLCTESRAKIAIVIVYVVCFVATITTPLEWEVNVAVNVLDGNRTEEYVSLRSTPLGVDETYQNVFYWFWSITFVFLPLILLSIFNSFLIYAVHRSRKARCQMTQTDHATSTQKQENRITITLIAVVLLFMICQIPTAILLILRIFYKVQQDSNEDKLFRALGNIFNFLVTINAAANFILYCALSARYRVTILSTFFKSCYKATPVNQTSIASHNFSRYGRASTRSTLREKSSTESLNSKSFIQRPNNGLLHPGTPDCAHDSGEEFT